MPLKFRFFNGGRAISYMAVSFFRRICESRVVNALYYRPRTDSKLTRRFSFNVLFFDTGVFFPCGHGQETIVF